MVNPRWVPSYTNSGEGIAVRLGRRPTRGRSASTTSLDPWGQLAKRSNRRTSCGGGETGSIWRNNRPDSISRLKVVGYIYERQGQTEEAVKNEGNLHICHNMEFYTEITFSTVFKTLAKLGGTRNFRHLQTPGYSWSCLISTKAAHRSCSTAKAHLRVSSLQKA